MVRLLFFMNIICVKIPSAKLYQALSHKSKGWQFTKIAMSCGLTWKVEKTHTNKNHSNIWMESVN